MAITFSPSMNPGGKFDSSDFWYNKIWYEFSGRAARDEQREWDRQQALEAYQRDVDMWRMNNEYNSPAEQMKRYQEAGLNPNLIYSQGNAGNSSSFPHMQAPTSSTRPSVLESFQKIASVIGTLVGLKTQLAQSAAIAAKTKQTLAGLPWIPRLNETKWKSALLQNPYLWYSYQGSPEMIYESPSSILHDVPGWWQIPGIARAARQEQQFGLTSLYQGDLQAEKIRHTQLINDLLRMQKNFFKFDKYIGYGTDILGSILGIANFGLGVGKFNAFKNRMY